MNKRQKNKLRKNTLIVLDIQSLPEGLDLKTFADFSREGFIVWDSTLKGEEPKIYPTRNKKLFKFVDKNK